MLDFIVLGLPRSGTTWAANWLTTDRTLCLHDPFSRQLPEHWPRDHRKRGISCTGAYLLPGWLAQQRCPVFVIERDRGACDASLRGMGLLATTDAMVAALAAVDAPRIPFAELWDEASAKRWWKRIVPGVAFDAPRYRLLRDVQIQPDMKKWTFDEGIVNEMLERETTEGT